MMADMVLMNYASGPVTWECIEWAAQSGHASAGLSVAISLPRMARFQEGTPERILWASEATARMLAPAGGPDGELVTAALRKGSEGLRRQGHFSAAQSLEDALRQVEARRD
jgi:hypothetical protein